MSTQFTNRQWRLPNEENKSKVSNYSMDFDSSSSDYIDVGTISSLNAQQNFSISLWFKENVRRTNGFMFSSGTGASNDIAINAANGTLKINVGGTRNVNITSYSSNVWYHVVLTVENTTAKVYLDNGSPTTVTVGSNTSSSSGTLAKIGDLSFASGYYFDGQIDAVSIYNYALTDGTGGTVNQIAALYGSSSTGIGNPMAISGGGKPVFYAPLGDQDAFNGANYLVPNSSLKDYVFDNSSSNNRILISNNSIPVSGNSSISFWFNADTNSGYKHFITSQNYYTTGINNTFSFQISGTTVRFIFANGQTLATILSTTIDLNTWYNLTVTLNISTDVYKVYLNGTQVGLDTSLGGRNISDLNQGFSIFNGLSSGSSTYNAGFIGKLSNVQIFNTELPATGSNSVETLYNNGSPLTSMTGFTSLQGWWKLDASDTYDSSTNTWSIPDDSTNSNDGTSSGMTQANLVVSDLSYKSGFSPYALDFDSASGDYIDCGDSDDFSFGDGFNDSPFSVSAWINITGTTSQGIVTKYSSSSSTREYTFYTTSGKLRLLLWGNGVNNYATGTSNLSINTWYHVACTYDGRGSSTAYNGITLYINGVAESVTTSGGSYTAMSNTSQPVYLGKENAKLIDGKLSNVSVWNTALTSAQVTEIYSEGIPQNLLNHSAVSSLVSWWQLGSNSSFNTNWTILDEKGSNNGTSVNMGEDAIVDGVGSYANGLSSGMGGDEVIGDAPYSTANALSVNMDVEDRVTDTPS